MTTTVTLSEDDIAQAVSLFLEKRGLQIKGKVTVNSGDPQDPRSATISVQVESAKERSTR